MLLQAVYLISNRSASDDARLHNISRLSFGMSAIIFASLFPCFLVKETVGQLLRRTSNSPLNICLLQKVFVTLDLEVPAEK